MKRTAPPNPEDVKKEYEALLARPCETVDDLRALNLGMNNLNMRIYDICKRARIAYNCNTLDEEAKKDNQFTASEILPIVSRLSNEIGKKIVAHPKFDEVAKDFPVYYRNMQKGLALFREANIPLRVEEENLSRQYDAIIGGLKAEFKGETVIYQALSKNLRSNDRAERRAAFEAREKAFLSVTDQLDDLFSKMLKLRHQKALNAGFRNFRDYQFQSYQRFDYNEQDCFDFHDAIEKLIVPIMNELDREKEQKLGLDKTRPWDLWASSDSKSKAPFETPAELLEGCRAIFKKMDPELHAFFEDMITKKTLDLEIRDGKSGGGYCADLAMDNTSFIFMNTTGTDQDVMTLLHEAGHAFHNYFTAANVPLYGNRHSGSEFAEVASMSMELLARPYLDQFYSKEKLPLVLREQLIRALDLFPLIAKIDAFQHWVYTAGENGGVVDDPIQWRQKWLELDKRFSPSVDWTGHERYQETGWQYLHVFLYPFYFVDYGIAQVGAFAVWHNSLKDYQQALTLYKSALKLGGSQPLPVLFEAIGTKFGLDDKTLRPVLETVKEFL